MANRELNTAVAAETTLGASVSDSTTTLTVASSSGFPSVDFPVVLDADDDAKREVVIVTGVSGTTWTVTRGQDGTSGVAHDSGAMVALVAVPSLWGDLHDRIEAHDHSGSTAGVAVDHGDLDGLGDFTADHGSGHDSHDHSTALGTASLADLGTANLADADDLGTFMANVEVDGATEVASQALTTSYATVASVALTIPAGWGSWKCEAHATYNATSPNDGDVFDARISIDGTAQQAAEGATIIKGGTPGGVAPASIGGRRTGMTTTGSRSILLEMKEGTGDDITVRDVYLHARAVRTS